jgi:aminoglycoside phosphotransferase (APT) family kinase protein
MGGQHLTITPPADELEAVLAAAMGGRIIRIMDRRQNEYASTYSSEIVTCEPAEAGSPSSDGTTIRLFCKYGRNSESQHPRNLAFEASAHTLVAAPSGLTVPTLYAAHTRHSGEVWLVYSFIEGPRLGSSEWPVNLELGAEWLARFHNRWEGEIADVRLIGLPRIDRASLESTLAAAARGIAEKGAQAVEAGAWLAQRWERISAALVDLLAEGPQTVLHGEFYPANVLISEGAVWPVDWGSVAIGPGELDLAALIDMWDDESISIATRRYSSVRESGRFCESRLTAACLYAQLKWIPEKPWPLGEQRGRLAMRLAAALGIG